MRRWLLLFLLCLGCGGCNETANKPATLIESGYDEQEMEAAIARARQEVDSFIAELSRPTGENHAVKVPITDSNGTEHFWLTDLSYRDGQFQGVINNEPGIVKNVKFGEARTAAKADISDWMFMRGGKLHGNYTMRPLLQAMPKEEADRFRSMFAKP
jgi:uncharacterized protein YegJ (DUF2314 family)